MDELTDEEAIEALTDKTVVNPYLTLEALEIAIEALKERDELRKRLKIMYHRCVCLTEGSMCKYCEFGDCKYKEQEEQNNANSN